MGRMLSASHLPCIPFHVFRGRSKSVSTRSTMGPPGLKPDKWGRRERYKHINLGKKCFNCLCSLQYRFVLCCLKCEGAVELHKVNNHAFVCLHVMKARGSIQVCCDQEKPFGNSQCENAAISSTANRVSCQACDFYKLVKHHT